MTLRLQIRDFKTLLAVFLLAVPLLTHADSRARIVRISFTEGDVQIDRADGNGFGNAYINMPVTEATRLWTRDNGSAEVEFEDGSTLRIIPNTILTFNQLALRSSGARVTAVDMQEGVAYGNFRKHGDDEFTITVNHEQIWLPQAAQFRIDADQSQLRVAVFKGSVDVSGSVPSVTVRKDETVTFDQSDNTRYYLANSVSADPYDDWNAQRDQYLQQYANNSAYHDNNEYYYGNSDLNSYGSYVTVGNYGPLWRPYYSGAGWNPFLDGAWVYYPGFGYTWVSAYPWGWLPYHYGSWLFVDSYGWCWRPSRIVVNNFVPVTVVHNAPVGFRPPLPPVRHVGGLVPVGRGPATLLPPGKSLPGSGFGDPHRFNRPDTGEVQIGHQPAHGISPVPRGVEPLQPTRHVEEPVGTRGVSPQPRSVELPQPVRHVEEPVGPRGVSPQPRSVEPLQPMRHVEEPEAPHSVSPQPRGVEPPQPVRHVEEPAAPRAVSPQPRSVEPPQPMRHVEEPRPPSHETPSHAPSSPHPPAMATFSHSSGGSSSHASSGHTSSSSGSHPHR